MGAGRREQDMSRSAEIPSCTVDAAPDEMYAILAEAGCLVVTGMATPADLQAVRSELDPYLQAAKTEADDAEAFYPGHTRRVIALMHRSPTLCQLMTHPTVEHLGDRHLLENCAKWQLNVTAALEIGPGARDQILHREEDLYPYWTPPRPNLILASMWAISEFTAANGGTLIVPGSHRWDADRVAKPNEIVRAQMQPGSVLFWLGGTLHGGGANITEDQWRYGVLFTYTLGWLRTEENQHLSIPIADVLALPEKTRTRLGFDMDYNGRGLGFYDPRVLAPR
ncbi:MAG TPA: mitomycin antibiotic biosynthesis protein [Gammaproteobacteria bacterium]|nr:mitomycin antibiotic biosynthesis protein [Gammaproteobacteria bacterium]